MVILIMGLLLFFGTHLIPTTPNLYQQLNDRFGPLPFKGLFSLLSAVGLIMIVVGYGLARLDPIIVYTPPFEARALTLILMMPVFILLIEFMLPGKIAAKVKHPMLLAVKLWAFAHLFSNGNLADILLFTSFLAYAIIDRISVKKRGLPEAVAHEAATRNDIIAIVGGSIIYSLFILWLHPILIGIPVY